MDGRGSELNEGGLSGCAGAEPKIGNVIEIGLTALDAGLPLRLKVVVCDRTTDGFRVEFLGRSMTSADEALESTSALNQTHP